MNVISSSAFLESTCVSNMDEYFTKVLNDWKSDHYGVLTIVLGNESCDLDSAVSSLVYAVFLHWQYHVMKCKVCTKGNRDESVYKDDIFLPVLNVDRFDYDLKTEVAYFFKQNGIKQDQLIFMNDIDLKQLVANRTVKVVLVDHHVLSKSDRFLTPYVTEIIDHRPIDNTGWEYKADTRSTIEIVGSCCTLVAQRIKDLTTLMGRGDFFTAFPVCGDMLHSTIILDTVNFSKELNKATSHDEEVILFLETYIKLSNVQAERKNKLDRLMAAKSDVSQLTAAQLLRKDVKVFGTILVPSFPILVKEFLQKPDVKDALSEALVKRNCTAAVLLGMDLTAGMKRDTAIYAKETAIAEKLSSFLEKWSDPPLQLTPQPDLPPSSYYYKQMNFSATRKQYIPALNNFLSNKL